MSEMVERVARAICQNVHGGNDPCPEDYQAARAAIEAMREPTAAMTHAVPASKSASFQVIWPTICRDLYRVMVDAALASEPKP